MIAKAGRARGVAQERNPFPGLRPFRADEEALFFGRDAHVDRMVDALRATGFLAVLGASGSGKSSLVTCGLVPALHRGLLAPRPGGWRVVSCRPGNRPIRGLAESLAAELPSMAAPGGFSAAALVEATLRASRRGLLDVWHEAGLADTEQPNLLLIVDQFEELFRYRGLGPVVADDQAAEAVAFVNLLLEVSAQEALPLAVVITMRSDFLGECAQFHGLPEVINRSQFLVPRMTREERRDAVRGPLAMCGASIDPVLLNRLVNDVGDNPDQLSLLQHALNRTWARWKAVDGVGPVRGVHYDDIGTMEQALDRHANEALAMLSAPRQVALCEKVFRAITDQGTDARGVRRPTRLDTLQAIVGADGAAVAAVIAPFRDADRGFLMPPEGSPLEPDTPIDISHESLMRVWTLLKRWTEAEAQSARLYRRLAETAALHAQGDADLLSLPELQLALAWRTREKPNRAWADRYAPGFDQAMAFLEASDNRMRWRRRAAWAIGIVGLVTVSALGMQAADRQIALETARAQLETARANANAAEASQRLAAAVTAQAEARRIAARLETQEQVLSELARATPQSVQELRQRAKAVEVQPQVFMMFADERQRSTLENLRRAISTQGYKAPALEKVSSVPGRNELRYFRDEDLQTAVEIAKSVMDTGIRPVEPRLVKGVTAASGNQFELWVSPPAADDQVSRLAEQISGGDKDRRLQALQQLKDHYARSPEAIAAVLALLAPDRIDQLSAEGRFNALWFLARTEPASWTPGLVQTGRDTTRRLRARESAGVAIGQQTSSELAALERMLKGRPA